MGTSGLIQSPVCFNHSASFTDSIEVSWKIVRLNMGLVSGVVRNMSEYDPIQNRNRRVFRPLTSHIDFYSTLLSPDFDLRKSLIEYQRNCTCTAFVVYLIKEKV